VETRQERRKTVKDTLSPDPGLDQDEDTGRSGRQAGAARGFSRPRDSHGEPDQGHGGGQREGSMEHVNLPQRMPRPELTVAQWKAAARGARPAAADDGAGHQ
jgi:hypothetical protein